jgi:hypothetical protein
LGSEAPMVEAISGPLSGCKETALDPIFVLVACCLAAGIKPAANCRTAERARWLALLVLLVGGIATHAAMGVVSTALRRYWLAIPAVSAAMIPLFIGIALTFVDRPPFQPLTFTVLVLSASTITGWAIAYPIWLRHRDE